MKNGTLLFVLLSCSLACAQTFTGLTIDPSVKNWDGGGMCAKSKSVLETNHTTHILVELYIDADGNVSSYRFEDPKGLRLKNDPDVRQAFKETLRFVPLRMDGQPSRAIIDMDVDCAFYPPTLTQKGPRK